VELHGGGNGAHDTATVVVAAARARERGGAGSEACGGARHRLDRLKARSGRGHRPQPPVARRHAASGG
jgi:hypothetical protein